MKVYFLEHVLHVAKAGEVKEVNSGYASNFLFPKKLAKPFTAELEKSIKDKAQKKESDRRYLLGEKDSIIKELSGKVLNFYLSGSGEKLYGSVTAKDIAEKLSKQYKVPLTKKHIDIIGSHNALKTLGIHSVYVDLGNNFATKISVELKKK